MAGKMELGPPKTGASCLREQSARMILRTVRSRGHPYVELRENGKKSIYFCVLCLAPCYSDCVLFDHLKGNLHKGRLSTAKRTLLGPNPWPFNDGVVFFDTSMENDKGLETRNGNQNRLLEFSDNGIDNLAIVKFTEAVQSDGTSSTGCKLDGESTLLIPHLLIGDETSSTGCKLDGESTLLIPHLLIGDETFDVKIREVGLGKIAARFLETYNTLNGNGIKRIWCEWLGKENNNQQDGEVLEHDYAVVIFPYNYDLGRSGLLDDDDVKSLLPSASITEPENIRERGRKRKAPSSDPEDMSDSLSKQYDSSADESSVTSVDQCDNQLLRTKFISSKTVRKELRRQQRLASEKVCNICQQKMLPGKDVAALLNLKTGRLACSSRNRTGAFHVFHTSCLIHWVLLCEYDIITNRIVHPNVRKGGNRKVASNCSNIGKEKDMEAATAHIETVFCPECQGHGLTIDGDGVEHPDFFSLSQMFKFKIKACDARIEWTKSPEDLQTCSIGLHFPSEFEGIVEEKVEPIKLLHFYRVDDQSGT